MRERACGHHDGVRGRAHSAALERRGMVAWRQRLEEACDAAAAAGGGVRPGHRRRGEQGLATVDSVHGGLDDR
eukprot:2250459-Prymnesium_polylepis.2